MRPFPSSMSLLRLCALAFFLTVRLNAEVLVTGIDMDPKSGVDLKITSMFKQLPQAGYATLQIYIRNNSGQARTWTFQFNGNSNLTGFHSDRSLSVPNNTEQTFEVLVPLGINDNSTYASNFVQITASGYGVYNGSASLSSSTSSGRTLTDFTLMSQALTVRSWGPLDKACEDKGLELQGSEFNPNYLPNDWRGYLGVGTMWITDTEWRGLDPIPRNAIRDWVFQGGALMICSTEAGKPSDFGFQDGNPGYGFVGIVKWDGRELNAPDMVKPITSRDHSIATHVSEGYQTKWDLPGDIGHMQFNGIFILLFVVCFGVVIGPMNLFWFAKSGRRHRLFWTIPLISVAGSVLLAVVIILEDGFGGEGNRMTLVQLIPGENEELVAQEQVSRTGLLISSKFDTEDKLFIVPLTNLPGTSTYAGYSSKARGNYTVNPRACSGDWFVSRSVQAQLMEVTRPSRARMEIVPGSNGAAPALVSSIENNIDQVFYIDDSGHYWQAGPARVGEKMSLKPATEAEFDGWLKSNREQAGARINYLLDAANKRRGYFYAVAQDAKADAVATLPTIRWNKTKTIYLGPCATGKGTP